jgi:DNA (cytosine-5)-methyltransferase 1
VTLGQVSTIRERSPLPSQQASSPAITCVDLFCGVGGLTHGLKRGGIDVVAGVDLDSDCQFPYEFNNDGRFVQRSVGDLTPTDVTDLFGKAKWRLIAGCAPCQPYSTYSRQHRKGPQNSEWELVGRFGRLIEEVQPDFVTMENVPRLSQHPVFDELLSHLDGFSVSWRIVECSRIGVPQTRSRLVLLASRHGSIQFVTPASDYSATATVRQAIGGLPSLAAGDTDPNDPLHAASKLSSLNLRRIRSSVPGGTWRDWDEELRSACHRKLSGQTYPSVYGRMEWDRPAPTITTQCFGFGNGRFGHPEQDRAISLREAAILQTFPRTYQFLANGHLVRFSKLGRLIGNAVPVRLGEVIADSIRAHAESLTITGREARQV